MLRCWKKLYTVPLDSLGTAELLVLPIILLLLLIFPFTALQFQCISCLRQGFSHLIRFSNIILGIIGYFHNLQLMLQKALLAAKFVCMAGASQLVKSTYVEAIEFPKVHLKLKPTPNLAIFDI